MIELTEFMQKHAGYESGEEYLDMDGVDIFRKGDNDE